VSDAYSLALGSIFVVGSKMDRNTLTSEELLSVDSGFLRLDWMCAILDCSAALAQRAVDDLTGLFPSFLKQFQLDWEEYRMDPMTTTIRNAVIDAWLPNEFTLRLGDGKLLFCRLQSLRQRVTDLKGESSLDITYAVEGDVLLSVDVAGRGRSQSDPSQSIPLQNISSSTYNPGSTPPVSSSSWWLPVGARSSSQAPQKVKID
jgi:hypothetical protein